MSDVSYLVHQEYNVHFASLYSHVKLSYCHEDHYYYYEDDEAFDDGHVRFAHQPIALYYQIYYFGFHHYCFYYSMSDGRYH